jgi:hypothetical protein
MNNIKQFFEMDPLKLKRNSFYEIPGAGFLKKHQNLFTSSSAGPALALAKMCSDMQRCMVSVNLDRNQ